jgi:alanyl-tRNA synthetase
MNSQKLRQEFLQYFKNQGHSIVPSSPVIPHDDPTLLFINAGMNQFKDVFLGKSKREYSSATTTQKCIRVGGKHNDLENVGHTSRHLTFFEMLGNFSFGKYFKKEAIHFAWEVTLKNFQFDTDRVWATVFYEDDEAFELWKTFLPEERIVRMGEKDNFWSMGDIGPCGPCSELLFDRGEKYGPARSPAEDVEGERYLEFWNLVFMQYNRAQNGELTPLPKPCVDTGCGLERIISLKMGVDSLFETDILRSLIRKVEELCPHPYKEDERAPAFRVIADHIRCLAFAIADGVQPSNLDRGYVLRKVLRRAVRYARQLDITEPFLAKLVPSLVEMMGSDFVELKNSEKRIQEILTQEEESFIRTLKRGGNLLASVMEASKSSGQISGDDAFKLKDTYGLPLEEILLIARDDHLAVDLPRFEELEHEAKLRSKQAHKSQASEISSSLFEEFSQKHEPSLFDGYGRVVQEATVLGIVHQGAFVQALEEGEAGEVILNQTPFYPEKGGQIGDQGHLYQAEHTIFNVLDTQSPYPNVITHHGVMHKGRLVVGQTLEAMIDAHRREEITRHHTATHLLHWALQEVLGPHIQQAGSVVEERRLRFDFNHHKAMTPQEIKRVETLVNQKIRSNLPVQTYELAFSEVSKREDIKQFFGDKYGSTVRVVDAQFSKELCGGTHVNALGEIGLFLIDKESSVAAGVRRIEAVVGASAEEKVEKIQEQLLVIAQRLKAQPHQVEEKLEKLLSQEQELAAQVNRLKKESLHSTAQGLKEKITSDATLCEVVELPPKELQLLADTLMSFSPRLALFLIGKGENNCQLLVRVSKDLIKEGVHAGEWLKSVAPIVDGKGGGRPESAQGGGSAVDQIPKALEEAKAWIQSKINS